MAELKLGLVVQAIDKATAPLRTIGRAVQKVNRETGLDRVAVAAGRVGRQLGRVGGEAALFARRTGLASLAAGAATLGLAGRFANAGDNIAKTADRLGLGVVELQRWRYAAERSGVSAQTFDMAVQRFGRRAAEAAAGTGEAKDALKFLGIQLRDTNGNMRPTEALMGDVADALSKIEDPLLRNRVAFKLFDSEGVDVGRMLAQGKDRMREYGDEAERLGVFTEEQARASERYKDELTAMQRAVSFLGHTIGGSLLPFLTPLIRDVREFAIASRPEAVETMRGVMSDLGGVVRWLGSAWKSLRERGEGWLAWLQETFPAIREWIQIGREWLQEMGLLRLGALAVAAALGARLIRAILGLFGPLARLGIAVVTAGVRMLWLAGVGIFRLARALRGLPGLFWRAGRSLALFARRAGAVTFAALIGSLRGAASAMRALNRVIRANPVGLVLTALAGAALLVYEYWDDIVAFFESLWQDVKAALGVEAWIAELQGFSLFAAMTGWLAGIVGWFGRQWTAVKGMVPIGAWIAELQGFSLFAAMTGWLAGIVGWFGRQWTALKGMVPIGAWIAELQGFSLFAAMTGWLAGIVGWFGRQWTALKGMVPIGAWIAELQGFSLFAAMTGWLAGVVGWFQARWSEIRAAFDFEGLKAWLGTIDLWDVVTAPIRGVVAYYSAVWRGIRAVFDWTGLTEWLSQFSLFQTLTGWWSGIVAEFETQWAKIESIFSTESLKAAWREFSSWLRSAIDEVLSILPSWLGGPEEEGDEPASQPPPGARGPGPRRPGGRGPVPSIFDAPVGGPPGALVPAAARSGRAPDRFRGEVRIAIDQEGRARVRELHSDNRDIDLSVDSGFSMASP